MFKLYESELASLLRLGINIDQIAIKARHLRSYHEENRNRLFYELLPEMNKKWDEIKQLETDLYYEEDFCNNAGINYLNPKGLDSNCLKIAITQLIMQNNS
jgi:hypothetical protein